MPSQSLDGSSWTMHACGGDPAVLKAHPGLKKPLPVQVPGSTHGQLLRHQLIPDPFLDRNELEVQWVDQLDWDFERELVADAADCARDRQELVFEGIDTVATVLLNGREVGSTVNMFRQVVCDVRGVLQPGRNRLTVRIGSPTAYSAGQVAANPEHICSKSPALRRNRQFEWQTGEKRDINRPWIRKVQCHFGWDWGVCLPTQGIWMPCRLECADAPRIDAVTVTQRHQGPVGAPSRVELTVQVALAHRVAASGTVRVTCAGQNVRVPARVEASGGQVCATLAIERPRLWWPNGYGEQPLYDLEVAWEGGGEPQRRRIGLRTIELVTTPDTTPEGKPGESMIFRVNGRDIYAKGANWIPAEQFVERCTPAVYRHLLAGMAEAHMNMVRVWGGGWYELDAFYDLCDELGLLVWQDFMMACALFPDTPAYIAEVEAEARHQVRRLQHRCCIALWCGDNENLVGVNHWWKDPRDPDGIKRGYATMMTALRAVVQEEDAGRRFWVSSPSNGWLEGDPHSHAQGDEHYWQVWHGRKPFSDYLTVKPRFVSEFGFQSFPEPRTLRACVPAQGLNPSSWHMEHHQRSNDGNQLITNTIARELPIPAGLDAYCWASQINQANAIRTAVEHWRRLKPYCAGAIYWQINDIWPVASWSSIDYHGRWKALQHAAKRFFAPLLVSFVQEGGSVAVWATSDLGRRLRLKGRLLALRWDGRPVASRPLKIDLPADGSAEVLRIPVEELLAGKAAVREVCLFAELEGDGEGAVNHCALVPWKHVALPRPKLSASLKAGKGGIELTLKTDRVAPFVHAEIRGTESHFDGSFDVLRPGVTYRWRLVEHRERGQKPLTLAQAKMGLKLFSLYDLAWRED